MGLFGFDPLKGAGGWEELMTEQEIADMEKKGIDMSEVRKKRQQNNETFEKQCKETAVATDVTKLSPYCNTPRNTESEFIRDIAGKPPLFGKGKWVNQYSNAPLIYCAVVQANKDLLVPGNKEMLPAALVFALDNKHKYDIDWLKETATKINLMRESESVPDDCREFIDMLQLEQQQLCFTTGSELAGSELMYFHSEMCFPLGSSLVGDANAWCVLYKFKTQDLLPSHRLPDDGIVPFLLLTPPKKKTPIHFAEIPSKYYQV